MAGIDRGTVPDVGGGGAPPAEDVLSFFEAFQRIEDEQALVDEVAAACARVAGFRAALLTLALPGTTLIGFYGLTEAERAHFREVARNATFEERAARRARLRERAFPGTGIVYLRHAAEEGWNVLPTPDVRGVAPGGEWDPRDTLYVLVCGQGGKDIGVLSLDAPANGRIPRVDDQGALGFVERLVTLASALLEARLLARGLVQSEARRTALFEQAGEAILLVDVSGRLLDANPSAARQLGVELDELRGGSLLDFEVGLTPDGVAARWEALGAGSGRTVETSWRRSDGDVVPVELALGRIVFREGEALLVFARDVRARRALEQRERELQKTEALVRLAGAVAHDFRNVLAVVQARVELALAAGAASQKVAENLEAASQALARARGLTQDLLSFSRKTEDVPTVLDLSACVRARRDVLRRLLPAGVDFAVEASEEPLFAFLGQAELDQILLNLVLNAADAVPAGGHVVVRALSGAGARLVSGDAAADVGAVLEVEDDGAGMDAETAGCAFEPFFTTKVRGQGTGLGLATVHGIVTRRGGKTELDTAPGRGTRIRILWPRVAGPFGA